MMKKAIFKNIFIYFLAFFCLLPLVIMIFNSFRVTTGFGLEQYIKVLLQSELFMQGFWNSVLYTVIIICINVPISLLAAYGFTYFKFKGKLTLFWAYIVLMLMPFQATIVPQYLTLKTLGILDSAKAVILPNAFSTFGTFLIAQYMKGLDKEILEAGRMDGLNEFGLMVKLAMPICKPIFSALIVLLFINYWSMVEQPIIFLNNSNLLPLSVTLNESGVFRSIAFACGAIFTILPILLYLYSYDDLIKGIAVYSSNIQSIAVKNKGKGIKGKQRIFKAIIIFLVFMSICTLITQKVTNIMTADVDVVRLRQGELMEQNNNMNSESLGYYSMIVPSRCLVKEDEDYYIYVVEKSKFNENRFQAIKTSVRVLADNKIESAIDGGINSKAEIVLYKSMKISDGSNIKIVNQSNSNMKGMVEFVYTGGNNGDAIDVNDISFLENDFIIDYKVHTDSSSVQRFTVTSKDSSSNIFFKDRLLSDISNKLDYSGYVVKDYTANEKVLSQFKLIYIFILQCAGFVMACYLIVNLIKNVICFCKKRCRDMYLTEFIDVNASELLIAAIKSTILFFIGIFLLREIINFQFFILGEYIPPEYILDFNFYYNAIMYKKDLALRFYSEYENLYSQTFDRYMLIYTFAVSITVIISIVMGKIMKKILCRINNKEESAE